MKPIRTRFAPSPTGFLHIGGIRTTLFAYLLAKKTGGNFILRIEDTDRERIVPGAIQALLEDLAWVGIDIDEGPSAEELAACDPSWVNPPGIGGSHGPYVQSQRLEYYQKTARELVESGAAYRCDCTPERLKQVREEQQARKEDRPGYDGHCRSREVSESSKHVVRLKLPDSISLSLDDAVKGPISWDQPSLRDPVILKSDGYPTYHLANVVDDHLMQITHVLRGDEWLGTTPIHLLLYDALGWERPVFAHLPVVMGEDGKKLSKRHGARRALAYKEEGFLAEAVLNTLVLIGWNPGEGEEQEVFTKQEMIERFSLDKVSASSGVFSEQKLEWMNGVYIRNMSVEDYCEAAMPFLEEAGLKVDREKFASIAPHIQERTKRMTEIPEKVKFLFVDQIERDMPSMFKKGIDEQIAKTVLERSIQAFEAAESFAADKTQEVLRGLAEELELKAGPMFGVIRIAVTGSKVTPPLFESLETLGKDTTLFRLKEALQAL